MAVFCLSASLKRSTALTAVWLLAASLPVGAGPQNGQVVQGSAIISTPDASTTRIEQNSQAVIIDWSRFDIDRNETTRFEQPNRDAWALNRVVGSQDPSVISGTLEANGNIAIVNPDGILFSRGARIDVGGLVATTANISNDDFMAGRLNFDLPGNTSASIVNEGDVTIADHGLAAFVAPGVRNSGVIAARLGQVSLASGNRFSLDLYGDGLVSLAIDDEIADAVYDVATGQVLTDLVHNAGKIRADGGTVALSATTARRAVNSVINQSGVLEARSVGMRQGKIILGAQTQSSPKPSPLPAQRVKVTGQVNVSGPAPEADWPLEGEIFGGFVQITGANITLAGADIDASGAQGGGTILIGGDYLGGRPVSLSFAGLANIQEAHDVPNADTVLADEGTRLNASATHSGAGGKIVLWSQERTTTSAEITATGKAGQGGFVETSSAKSLGVGSSNVTVGEGGTWLLDPESVIVTNDLDGWSSPTQTISATTVSNTLSSGSSVVITAEGPNATLGIRSPILKTAGGTANLNLISDNYIDISSDIKSTAGALNVRITNAESPNSTIRSNGEFYMDGANIETNGGEFRFVGHRFYVEGLSRISSSIGSRSRILTQGGDVNFFLSGGGDISGFGDFAIDAGGGNVQFGLPSGTSVASIGSVPRVDVGDLGIKTSGSLTIKDVRLVEDGFRDEEPDVVVGTVSVAGSGEFRFSNSAAPGYTVPPLPNTAPSVISNAVSDIKIKHGESWNGITFASLFSDDGGSENLSISVSVSGQSLPVNYSNRNALGIPGTSSWDSLGGVQPGTYFVSLSATDGVNEAALTSFRITVEAPPVVIVPPVDPDDSEPSNTPDDTIVDVVEDPVDPFGPIFNDPDENTLAGIEDPEDRVLESIAIIADPVPSALPTPLPWQSTILTDLQLKYAGADRQLTENFDLTSQTRIGFRTTPGLSFQQYFNSIRSLKSGYEAYQESKVFVEEALYSALRNGQLSRANFDTLLGEWQALQTTMTSNIESSNPNAGFLEGTRRFGETFLVGTERIVLNTDTLGAATKAASVLAGYRGQLDDLKGAEDFKKYKNRIGSSLNIVKSIGDGIGRTQNLISLGKSGELSGLGAFSDILIIAAEGGRAGENLGGAFDGSRSETVGTALSIVKSFEGFQAGLDTTLNGAFESDSQQVRLGATQIAKSLAILAGSTSKLLRGDTPDGAPLSARFNEVASVLKESAELANRILVAFDEADQLERRIPEVREAFRNIGEDGTGRYVANQMLLEAHSQRTTIVAQFAVLSSSVMELAGVDSKALDAVASSFDAVTSNIAEGEKQLFASSTFRDYNAANSAFNAYRDNVGDMASFMQRVNSFSQLAQN